MEKKYSKWLKIAIMLSVILFLTACGSSGAETSGDGFWSTYIIANLSRVLLWLSGLFGNNYAMGIIVFTIIIRLLLFPLNKMQANSTRKMQEIQPELDAIKEKYPNKDRASMEAMQAEQQALMEARGVNQFAGCLPMLIQLPVMIALYNSITSTQEIQHGNFFWTNLGQVDPYFILPVIAAALTFANSYFTMKANPVKNSATTAMTYVMPAMILFISVGLPSAVTLYWVISNTITLAQTFLFNNPYKIIAEREAKVEAEKERQRELRRALKRATKKKK